MSILVQKFGGTSVANAEKILAAAARIVAAKRAGNQVVVVVSARGGIGVLGFGFGDHRPGFRGRRRVPCCRN